MPLSRPMHRRKVLKTLAGLGGLGLFGALLPAYGRSPSPFNGGATPVPGGTPRSVEMDLRIDRKVVDIAGARASATTINNGIPGPLVELWEGQDAVLRVTNDLDEDSSIHWHGILLPFEMDGVPGVAFPGIKPGETFEARFPVRQYGTYWYHSHSGLQEQTGTYGPLVIHPESPDPFTYDRDYVVLLSDWTFDDPHDILANLKKMSHYYNFNRRTVGDFFRDAEQSGWKATLRDRLAWGQMRMTPTDIADVTGYTYTYLMNGLHPDVNWTGLFQPGERVRLRFINASAMTYFNIRLPGLPMTVVQADGQNVQPVDTDELQIAVAETYDVIVQPREDRAYTLMAESMDRSGYAAGTLAPRHGMRAPVPALREPPQRTMVDMGMAMHGGDRHAHGENPGTETGDATGPMGDTPEHSMAGMDHSQHRMPEQPGQELSGVAMTSENGMDYAMAAAGPVVANHGPDQHGPGNIAVAEVQRDRLAEPGTGLENVGHRVLTYAQLRNVVAMQDRRPPSRTFELHLTGNMERYMWSFDGQQFHEVTSPIDFPYGERVRLVLVNDTMMEHPIHLHGMFMELENDQGDYLPFKHTVSVKPAERMSLLITANEPGRWAFHCHFLYHMEMGMFRVVRVRGGGVEA
ncbi:MAG: copper resistance protein CopA [Porticoccaceae bacterium]|nr:copper resistance protein CopA [Porticoccaceae bacterium]